MTATAIEPLDNGAGKRRNAKQISPKEPTRPAQGHASERFLTLDQAAEYLNVSPRTVRRYVRDRRLKSYLFGGSLLRFRKSDLDRWAERWVS